MEEKKDMADADARSTFTCDTYYSHSLRVPPPVYVHNVPEADNDRYRNLYGATIDTSSVQPGGDDVYDLKVKLLNEAMLDMGMGRYQWLLTLVTGLGWFLDNFWMFSFAFIQPAVANETNFFTSNVAFLTVTQYVGLTVGASVLPMMSDFIGRKLIFNLTLALLFISGLVAGGMPTFPGLCVVSVFLSLAAGGNQAVDTAILIEMIPSSHQYLLTMQGMYSGLGKLVAALIAWPLMTKFSCPSGSEADSCHYDKNMGWRYTWWTFGALTLVLCLVRFCFHLHETPKYLLGQGRDAEVVTAVETIASFNKKETWLNLDHFEQIDRKFYLRSPSTPEPKGLNTLRQSLGFFNLGWLRGVFATSRLTLATYFLVAMWSLIGVASPLHEVFIARYLASKGVESTATASAATVTAAVTYQTYIYQALCAIPGPIIGSLALEAPALGRKRTGSIVSALAGIVLFLYATARSHTDVIAWSCVASFFQSTVISIMYQYTAETYAAPVRGTGLGFTGFFFRGLGLVSALVVAFTSTSTSTVPVWVAAACWIVSGALWLCLPYDMTARASN